MNNIPVCAPKDSHHVWPSGLNLVGVAVTYSILIVAYLLLVSTSIIEMSFPEQKPVLRLTSSRFSDFWTNLATGDYLFLFLYFRLPKHTIVSIGAQEIRISRLSRATSFVRVKGSVGI